MTASLPKLRFNDFFLPAAGNPALPVKILKSSRASGPRCQQHLNPCAVPKEMSLPCLKIPHLGLLVSDIAFLLSHLYAVLSHKTQQAKIHMPRHILKTA